MSWDHKSLLSLDALSDAEIQQVLDTASAFFQVSRRAVRKVPTLRGKTVINLFYESSTRTRTSFELAGKRLSADVINLSVSTSSVSKGETLSDTCKTLQAMQPDVVVIRHAASGAAQFVDSKIDCAVINAGDGMHAHPTQALIDVFSIQRRAGSLDGKTVAIVGDILHSRVARSNVHLMRRMGATVRLVGPRTLMPAAVESLGAEVHHNLADGIKDADVVMALRIQQERLEGALLPSLREYARDYGINEARMAAAKPDVIVMHPGPMNRGVEIDSALADGHRSVVLDQVEAGVAVRMALLYLYAADSHHEPLSDENPAGVRVSKNA